MTQDASRDESIVAIVRAAQEAYATGDSALAMKLRRQFKHAQIVEVLAGDELADPKHACVAFAVPENLALTLGDLEGTPVAEEAVNLGGILLILQAIDVELEGQTGIVRAATWIRFVEGLMQEVQLVTSAATWDATYRFIRIVDARAILPWEDEAIRALIARAPAARATLVAQYEQARFGARDTVTSPWRLALDVPHDAPRLQDADVAALGSKLTGVRVRVENTRSRARPSAVLEIRDGRIHTLTLVTRNDLPIGTTATRIELA